MMRTVQAILLTTSLLLATASVASAGPWRADEGNTRGWDLMSPEERIAHQARVRGFTDYQACLAYRTEHHQLMQQRAAARGLTLPESGRNFCDRLKPQPDQP